MGLKQKTVFVGEASDVFAEAIASIAVETIREVKDNGGWDTADDAPPIALKALKELPKAAQAFAGLKGELAQDLDGFLMSWMSVGQKVYRELAGKPIDPKAVEAFTNQVDKSVAAAKSKKKAGEATA